MGKYFSPQDFKDAELVLSRLSIQSNCYTPFKKIVRAKYLVAIDDDPTSAFYAADLYHQIYQTYGYFPYVLCVGGRGPLSKYTNEKNESEGGKLKRICCKLAVRCHDITVLNRGSNTGQNLFDIAQKVMENPGIVVMCLTQRLSLRIRQTWLYLDKQYETLDHDKFSSLEVYYYVPKQSMEDQLQVYNCKGLAKGLLYLSEIASIYNRIRRYSGSLQAPLDFAVTRQVVQASNRLEQKYPLKNGKIGFKYVWQFVYAWICIKNHKKIIAMDLKRVTKFYQFRFLKQYDHIGRTQYGLFLKK